MADAAVDQVAHYCKKGELDHAERVLETDAISKHPRAWAGIIATFKGDPVKQTFLLVHAGALRCTQVATDDGAADQIVDLVELLVDKASAATLHGRESLLSNFRTLIHTYTAIMRSRKTYARGMRTLAKAIPLFRPETDYLTPMHPDYVQLCLLAMNPTAGAKLMEEPVFEIDPAATGVKAVDFSAYFYYGGVCYTALRKFQRARDCFRNVLCVPAQVLSLPVVLAFKCLTLTNAITESKAISLPPHFEQNHERALRQLAKPYTDLTAALEARDDAQVARILREERSVFESDDLVGLVNQAVASAPRQAILALTRVYVTLTLKQIEQQVQVPAATVEQLLASMIQRNEIDATIDRASGAVAFGQGRLPGERELEENIRRANDLNQRIRDIDDRVISSKPHVMAKLRSAPNLRELLNEFEHKRKQSQGLRGAVQDALRSMTS
jgi:tetratricopeptide (TPR) repeat protein